MCLILNVSECDIYKARYSNEVNEDWFHRMFNEFASLLYVDQNLVISPTAFSFFCFFPSQNSNVLPDHCLRSIKLINV